jgi:peptidoglycan/xylan/chitin deacetylase (PgdA/CDA1 family)
MLYLSTLGAVGLGVRSVLAGPVPVPVAAGAVVAFGAVVMAGVLEPRLSMFADVVNDGPKSPGTPRVALTFDDGPGAFTPKVLDLLDEASVKGTFFVIGRKLERKGAAIAREIVARGHQIACHSHQHDRLFALRGAKRVREDLSRALKTIEDTVSVHTTLFRPPIGHTNPTIARVADELGLTVIGFSVRGYDGTAGARTEAVAERVTEGLEDGAIVLLHDGAERDDFEPVASAALPKILEAMKTRGLAGTTVAKLLGTAE